MRKALAAAIAAAGIFTAAQASAAIITATLPEFNGDGTVASTPIGTFSFVIPLGDVITGADLTTAFGNSEVNSSAVGDLFIDGLFVGHCADTGPCAEGPGQPVHFTFNVGDLGLLSDGAANLVYDQTDCCIIRLSASTLRIATNGSSLGAVPEPATWALMIGGFGAAGAMLRRRKDALAG